MSFKTISEISITRVQCDLDGRPVESTRVREGPLELEGEINMESNGGIRLDMYMFDKLFYSIIFSKNPTTGKDEIHYNSCELGCSLNAVFCEGVSYGYTFTEFSDDPKIEDSVVTGFIEALEIHNHMTSQGGYVMIRSRAREGFVHNYLLDIEIFSDGNYNA